jgi:hypothetical protein
VLFRLKLLLFIRDEGCMVIVALSNRVNGFSIFHLSFLLLLNSAGIFVDVLPRAGLVNDSNLFNKSIMNVKFH